MTLSAHLVETFQAHVAPVPPQLLRSFAPAPAPVGPALPPPDLPAVPPAPVPRQSYTMADPDQTWYSNHGAAGPSTSMSMASTSMGMGGPAGSRFSQWSEEKVARMQARLARKLGPEYVSTRQGPAGGGKLR